MGSDKQQCHQPFHFLSPKIPLQELTPLSFQHGTTLQQQPAQGRSLECPSRAPSAKGMGHSLTVMCIFVPKQTTPAGSIHAAACYHLGQGSLQPWEAETSWNPVCTNPLVHALICLLGWAQGSSSIQSLFCWPGPSCEWCRNRKPFSSSLKFWCNLRVKLYADRNMLVMSGK